MVRLRDVRQDSPLFLRHEIKAGMYDVDGERGHVPGHWYLMPRPMLVKGGAPQYPSSKYNSIQLEVCETVGHCAEADKSLVCTDQFENHRL